MILHEENGKKLVLGDLTKEVCLYDRGVRKMIGKLLTVSGKVNYYKDEREKDEQGMSCTVRGGPVGFW